MLVETREVRKRRRQVSVRFQVHYITSAGVQFIAITGDPRVLGDGTLTSPLQCGRDGVLVSFCVPAGRHGGGVEVCGGEAWRSCSLGRMQQ